MPFQTHMGGAKGNYKFPLTASLLYLIYIDIDITLNILK